MNPQEKLLADQARSLKAVMNIGKNGMTQGSLQLLDRELDQRGLVKVKLLRSHLEASGKGRKEVAEELAMFAHARLVQVVGNVVVLYRPMKRA